MMGKFGKRFKILILSRFFYLVHLLHLNIFDQIGLKKGLKGE